MHKVLGRLFRRVVERQQAAVSDYAGLVTMVASGKDVPDAQVDTIVEEAGKSPDDFAADVRRQARRRELAAIVAGESQLASQRKRLRSELQAIVAERTSAIREFNEKAAALELELQRLTGESQRIASVKKELESLAGDAALDPYRRAKHSAADCLNSSRSLRRRVLQLDAEARSHEQESQRYERSATPLARDRQLAKSEREKAEQCLADSEALNCEAAELERRAAELEQEATRERNRLYQLS